MTEYLHVAVGVILDQTRNVLISQRALASHQGGLWEFPGGKLEAGETVQQALVRELQEELGITINLNACFPFKKIKHHYRDKSVFLDVWTINDFSGKPKGKEGQAVQWMPLDALDSVSFPQANHGIIEALKLPTQIAITGQASDLPEFVSSVNKLLKKDIKLLQFRLHDLSEADFLLWAQQAKILCEKNGAKLLINTSPAVFAKSQAHGLHLGSTELLKLKSRPVPEQKLLGASCHNAAEIRHAEEIGVDFIVLSPVLETASHPQGEPLGWSGFRDLAATASLPVYALGGMQPTDLPRAQAQGAFGIAGISAFWET